MRIDTFLEWVVIFAGCLVALAVLFPRPFALIVDGLNKLIPHPSTVAKWLRDHGM
ncbi:MAG: hypothetical protein ACYSW6_11850 [Planctomycetota bacterium]|jgi:hypothetical protein